MYFTPFPIKASVVATCNKQKCQNSKKELLLCMDYDAKHLRQNYHLDKNYSLGPKRVPKKLSSKENTEISQIFPIFMNLMAKLFT